MVARSGATDACAVPTMVISTMTPFLVPRVPRRTDDITVSQGGDERQRRAQMAETASGSDSRSTT